MTNTVERELLRGPDQVRRHGDRLNSFSLTTHAQLASALRDGKLDPDDPAVLAAVPAAVTGRLLVANPRYLDHLG